MRSLILLLLTTQAWADDRTELILRGRIAELRAKLGVHCPVCPVCPAVNVKCGGKPSNQRNTYHIQNTFQAQPEPRDPVDVDDLDFDVGY